MSTLKTAQRLHLPVEEVRALLSLHEQQLEALSTPTLRIIFHIIANSQRIAPFQEN
jgi:hypothetical protein